MGENPRDRILWAIDRAISESLIRGNVPLFEDKAMNQAKTRLIGLLKRNRMFGELDDTGLEHMYDDFITFTLHSDKRIKTKFLPVIGRIMFLELGFGSGNSVFEYDFIKGDRLKDIFVQISKSPESRRLEWTDFDDYDFARVEREFGHLVDDDIRKKRQRFGATRYVPNDDYGIVRLHNLGEASLYGDFTGDMVDPETRVCYTQFTESWNFYTRFGNYSAYACLRRGWKETPCLAEQSAPFDRYGLSMLFIIINPYGEIAFSNTRWNHLYGEGMDSIDQSFSGMPDRTHDEDFLNHLLGRDYHEVLTPFNMVARSGCL